MQYRSDAHEEHQEAVSREIILFHREFITRKTFFKRMAALGYQQAEALKLAENWEDE